MTNGTYSSASLSSWFAALWMPRFHLQAALSVSSSAQIPELVAILDTDHAWNAESDPLQQQKQSKGHILHASQAAEQLGVLRGMTAAQALARCGSLSLLPRNPTAEEVAQQILLNCAGNWTPTFESTQPGLVVLDLSTARKLRPLTAAKQMVEWMNHHQLQASVGIAGKADLAILAARAATPVLVLKDNSSHADLLKQLPISVLNPTPDEVRVFQLWGIHTLAQLATLPRCELAERLGREGTYLWDMANGGQERLLKLVRPTLDFESSMELEYPVETLEPLLFILRRLLGDLCHKLADHWRVAASQQITLTFDDESTYSHTLRVAEPTRDADLLLRILHAHLESVSATAPIKAIQISLTPVRPAHQQTHLFERNLRDPNRLAETLAQLEAMLGPGRVGRVQLLPSRRVDAFRLVNYLDSHDGINLSHEQPTHGLCLRRFRPPREVSVHTEDNKPQRVQTQQALLFVKSLSGPWLSSGDWWDNTGHWECVLWEVLTSDGALYQLVYEPNHNRWVLDGIFA